MNTIDTPLIEQYCRIANGLRPMIEQIGNHESRLLKILPEYNEFLNKLYKEKQFMVLDELRFAHLKAKNADLRLDCYGTEKDELMFNSIKFPSTPSYKIENVAELPLFEKFAAISHMLRGQYIECDSIDEVLDLDGRTHARRIKKILPEYQKFLNELKEKDSKLLDELWWPQIDVINSMYSRRIWPEFMALTIIGKNGDGEGISYVDSGGQTLKESVDWVLSDNMKQLENIELLEPAKFYRHWNDINFPGHIGFEEGKEDKPKTTYSSVEDVLTDPKEYSDCTYFIATKVRINGLLLNKEEPIEVPLALSNWCRDNSKVMICREPHDPFWYI